jgi:hypothetical protein
VLFDHFFHITGSKKQNDEERGAVLLLSERMRMSAVLNTRLPVAGSTRMMRECKNGDPIRIGPINNSKREMLEKNSSSTFGCRRTGKWKSQGTSDCILNSCSETYTKPRLLLVVVKNLG